MRSEDSCLQGREIASLGKWYPTFRREYRLHILESSSSILSAAETLEKKATLLFETSGTTYRNPQFHISYVCSPRLHGPGIIIAYLEQCFKMHYKVTAQNPSSLFALISRRSTEWLRRKNQAKFRSIVLLNV